MNTLLIDNYDSFTYNLKALLKRCGAQVTVVRNDAFQLNELADYGALVLSPGPGVPEGAGQLKKLIETHYRSKPILGVCLGMQAIGEVLGGKLELMDEPLHGKATQVEHQNHPFFNKIPEQFTVGRYHSWIVSAEGENKIEALATDQEGHLMAIKAKEYPVFGVQFHPESVLTEYGEQLIQNFLNEATQFQS